MTDVARNCDDTAVNLDAIDSLVNIVNRGTIDSGAGENQAACSGPVSPFMIDNSATRIHTNSNLPL